jgi:hypothetical protein
LANPRPSRAAENDQLGPIAVLAAARNDGLHDPPQAKGWRSSALGGSCAHLIEKFDGEFAPVTRALNRESGIF